MLPRTGLASAATLICLGTSALAYQGTSPFVLRSTIPSIAIDLLNSFKPIAPSTEAYNSLKGVGCDWDALLVVDVEGVNTPHTPVSIIITNNNPARQLHHSHLKSNSLQTQTASSHQTLLSIPYVTGGTSEDLHSSVNDWVESCVNADGVERVFEIISVDKDESLPTTISTFLTAHSSHLALLTGHPTITTSKRQLIPPSTQDLQESMDELIYEAEMEEEVDEILDEIFGMDDDYTPLISEVPIPDEDLPIWDNADGYYDLLTDSNSTFNTTTPLLQHAQLFTTPIITALLITFGIFIPILVFGVSALAGIQVPPQMMSIAKTMSVSQSRKEQ